MAVNGRCYSFLEDALKRGQVGLNIHASITDLGLVVSLETGFAISLYETRLACKKLTDVRTLCHKFPGHLSDPIIKGFRHKHKGNALHIEVRLTHELFNCSKLRDFKTDSPISTEKMAVLISTLHDLFSAFQPVVDRSQLDGKCRARTCYDVPRLMVVARQFGKEWGFSSDDIVNKYNQMPQQSGNKKKRVTRASFFPKPDFSFPSSSSSSPSRSEQSELHAAASTIFQPQLSPFQQQPPPQPQSPSCESPLLNLFSLDRHSIRAEDDRFEVQINDPDPNHFSQTTWALETPFTFNESSPLVFEQEIGFDNQRTDCWVSEFNPDVMLSFDPASWLS